MNRLRIAIQKSGRLSDDCLKLLKQCGFEVDTKNRSLIARAKNQAADFILVRDDDIPQLVRDGVSKLGIVGLNELEEKILCDEADGDRIKIIKRLGFSTCRLSIAWPKALTYNGLQDLNGKRIATSYPKVLRRFLQDNNIEANIVEMSGSVELAPSIDLADGICDLVSTGGTLESNGLKEVETILDSEAVLIRNCTPGDEQEEVLIKALLRRIDSIQLAKNAKYIMMNAPKTAIKEISALLPGMEAPTVVPLSFDAEKVAIHAVAREDEIWETMEQLKFIGANSILVLPIEKIIE